MLDIYQTAIDCQDACNLSGVARTLTVDVLPLVWAEARAAGEGTEYVNTHPAVRLILHKLTDLARMDTTLDDYGVAYSACRALAQPVPVAT